MLQLRFVEMTYNTDRDQMSTALAQYIAKYAGERGGKGKQKTELQDAASIHSESRLKKMHKTVVTMEGKLFILIIT